MLVMIPLIYIHNCCVSRHEMSNEPNTKAYLDTLAKTENRKIKKNTHTRLV